MAGGVRVGAGAEAGVLTGAGVAGLELAEPDGEPGAAGGVELPTAEAQPAVTATTSSAAAQTPCRATPSLPLPAPGRLAGNGWPGYRWSGAGWFRLLS